MATGLKSAVFFKSVLIFLSALCFSTPCDSAESAARVLMLKDVMQEATAYNVVKPKYTITLLGNNTHLLRNAAPDEKFQFYKLGFWAAVALYQSEHMYHYANKMLDSVDFSSENKNLPSMLYAISLWYGVNKEYDMAILAGLCSIRVSPTEAEVARNIVSMGLTYLMTDHLAEAQQIFALNLKVSTKNNNKRGITAASNNLALYHIFTGNFDRAERYLRTALKINEEMARVNGTAVNLANLLLVFYMQRDWHGVYRITQRAIRTTDMLDNQDLQHYVYWVNTAFAYKAEGNPHLPVDTLVAKYLQVREPVVIKLIQVIAKDLSIQLPNGAGVQLNKRINFEQTFPTCGRKVDNEQALSDMLQQRLSELAQDTQAVRSHSTVAVE